MKLELGEVEVAGFETGRELDAAWVEWLQAKPLWWRQRETDSDRDLYADVATTEQLGELRTWLESEPGGDAASDAAKETGYTCDGCGLAPRCRFVFDAWNTNGDCLLEK